MPTRRTSRNGDRPHLTLYDVRDTDLLHHLAVLGDTTSGDLADELGMGEGHMAVAQRLSWMRRYGMVEYDDKLNLWRLTSGADRVLEARRLAARATKIEKVPDEQLVEVMAHVTTRYRLGDPMIAHLLRREFAFGTAPQSSVWRG